MAERRKMNQFRAIARLPPSASRLPIGPSRLEAAPTRIFQRFVGVLVLVGAALVAVASARDYAGSWNDGSRLATVESLGDRGTFIIDDSPFVAVPRGDTVAPYPTDEPELRVHGTLDKLYIDGHFYSDKSPVPSALLAALYRLLRWTTAVNAHQDARRFCYWMTLVSAGMAYVVAVWCTFRVALAVGLAPTLGLLLAASFGLATVALPYSRHVNGHILLLAVAAALQLVIVRWEHHGVSGPWRFIVTGLLAGLAYTIDLGVGPVLFVCTLALVAYRARRARAVALFAVGALPPILLHHGITFSLARTLAPPNTVAAFLDWPGSPVSVENMTGIVRQGFGHFVEYAIAMLIGKRGFLGHNLPLFLAAGGLIVLVRQRVPETPELCWAAAWMAGTWLLYSGTSNNYSGACASIRWFVPFLAPAYLILAVLLRERPRVRIDLMLFSAWGVVLAALMWREGPWMKHLVPVFWPIQAAAFTSWSILWWKRAGGTPVLPRRALTIDPMTREPARPRRA